MDIKPTLVAAWFGTAFISLIFSLTLLLYLSSDKVVLQGTQNFKLYAAIPGNETEVTDNVGFVDARSRIIENFFKGYNAPLADFGSTFVAVADKYSLDYRLLPSIAMQESLGGKRVIEDSYNPFGYGIYGNLVIRFSSWEEAIERVGRALKEDYVNQGLSTPEEIMAKYTPPSLEVGGTWAKGVLSFMYLLR